MQTILLPSTTCNAIYRKCRSFLWKDTNQTRKIHLLSWDKVGSSKKSGGLGIRYASKKNQALIMKNGWGLIGKRMLYGLKCLRPSIKQATMLFLRSNAKEIAQISGKESVTHGFWDVDKLRKCLPDEVVQRIVAMSPPSPWK